MRNKTFFFIAGIMALFVVSCSKEAENAAGSKAKAKTETVSFSVGISQEDTKAYFERTDAKEWMAKFNQNDKILVKATYDSGTILSIAEFTGGNKNVFNMVWTYPKDDANYSFFYPSSLGNGILDLRHQDPYVITYGSSDPGNYYALRGDVEGVKPGAFPKSISLKPLVAMLQVFPVGELNLVAKDAKGAFVTGIDSEGKIISSSEISQEEAVLFSTRDLKTSGGVVMIAVPAGEKLTFYNGDKELKTTRDSGLNAGSVVSLSGSGVGLDVKIELSPEVEVTLNSATVKGRIKVEGSESTPSIALQLGYNIYPERATAKHFFVYNHWPYEISGSSITLDKNGYFTVTIPELRESTTYYYIVRAIVNPTSCYQYDYFSETMSFTTAKHQISVETLAPKYVGLTEAEVDGYYVNDGYIGGKCYYLYSSTAATLEELISSGTSSYGGQLSGLERGKTYYYVANIGRAYGDVMSFTTKTSDSEFGEAVDLGLSVKWRSCNIGAGRPLDSGETYRWGETSEPLSGENYDKYNTGKDGKQVLDLEDDTAHYRLGGNWRMPTWNEFEELMNNCTIISKVNENPPHIVVCSNVPGYTDRSILLPVFSSDGDYGIFLWSSSLFPIDLNDVSPVPEPFCPYSYRAKFYSDRRPYSQFHCGVGLVERGDKFYIRPVLDDK